MRLPTVSVAIVVLVVAPLVADTRITVTYHSDPPGATIYEDGKPWGSAPFALRYNAPGRFRACLPLRPLKFRWVSGAEVDLKDLQACPAGGKKQVYTVFRPTGLPGVEIDAQYAAALLQSRGAAPAAVPVPVVQTPAMCTSHVIGRQVFTTCL